MKKTSPVEQVELHLSKQRSYNEEHCILSSENTIIERLLVNRLNMADVYGELLEKHEHWQLVMDAIIETAAGWNPQKIKAVRDDVRTINGGDGIVGINSAIKEKAVELAELLRKRNEICEKSGLFRPDVYHPLALIEPATKITGSHTHGLYTSHIKAPLNMLRRGFGRHYWPSIADMLDALAQMQDRGVKPMDGLDAVALKVRQSSVRDFWRILDVVVLRIYVSEIDHDYPDGESAYNIIENLGIAIEILPFLSDKSVASITNSALDLDAEIEPKHVKSYRSIERRRNK